MKTFTKKGGGVWAEAIALDSNVFNEDHSNSLIC